MTPSFRSVLAQCSVLFPAFFLAANVAAQSKPEEVVYATSSAGNRIVRVDFAQGTTTNVNSAADAKSRKKLQGLVVRNDGGGVVNLIVADGVGNGGAIVFYKDVENPGFAGNGQVITSAIPLPDGVSLDATGNIYAVNSGPGNASQKKRKVFRILRNGKGSSGYGDLPADVQVQTLDDAVPSSDLQDTKFVRATSGGLVAGDLLVLSASPATVFRYPNAATCALPCGRATFIGPSEFGGTSPQGMAFAPDGNLLVSTSGGDILRFGPAGARVLPNFSSGLGNGLVKIVVGFQDHSNRAFVAQNNGHRVRAFDIVNGTGTPAGVVSQGLNAPVGVGIGTGNAAPTPTGSGVTVQLNTFTSTFDSITAAGLTDASCAKYADPRESETPDTCVAHPGSSYEEDGFCRRDLTLAELTGGAINLGTSIPGHVRAFRTNDPTYGVPTFFLCQTATTAQFAGTISHVEEEGEWLNWPHTGTLVMPGDGEPPCRNNDPNPFGVGQVVGQVRAFWAPTPVTEPEIVEGNTFIDISNGCTGSNRSNPPNYSLFLPAVWDTRGVAEIVADKFVGLSRALAQFQCDDQFQCDPLIAGDPSGVSSDCESDARESSETLSKELWVAQRSAAESNYSFANCELRDFIKIIDANPESFSNTRNVAGELKSRALSTIFFLCKLELPPGGPDCTGALAP